MQLIMPVHEDVRVKHVMVRGGEEGIWKHIENFCNSALFKASSYHYHFHNVSPYLPHFPNVACGMSVKS